MRPVEQIIKDIERVKEEEKVLAAKRGALVQELQELNSYVSRQVELLGTV